MAHGKLTLHTAGWALQDAELKHGVRNTHLQACCCCLCGSSPFLHLQSCPLCKDRMLGTGTAVATAREVQEGEVEKPSGNGIQKIKRFEGKQFTYGTETEAGGTRCEHSVLVTSYLKIQMSLRCSWAQRSGTSRTGALEHCWVQLQGLGTTPENKEKLGCLMQEQGMPVPLSPLGPEPGR